MVRVTILAAHHRPVFPFRTQTPVNQTVTDQSCSSSLYSHFITRGTMTNPGDWQFNQPDITSEVDRILCVHQMQNGICSTVIDTNSVIIHL